MPLRPMGREQIWMLPPTLDELIPADHPSRFVDAYLDGLDRDGWAELGVDPDGAPMGAPAYHPRALLSVWLYGFMTGVRSTRKLEAACRDQIPFLWLTGWQRPDHNTLWRFYKNHRHTMRNLFKHTVRTAFRMQLVDLAVQAVDGTKVRANAANNRTYDDKALGRLMERSDRTICDLEAQNEAGEDAPPVNLPPEPAGKKALRERMRQAKETLEGSDRLKQVNLTDPDAVMMKTGQGITPAYNGQMVVSPVVAEGKEAGMFITAAAVVDDPTDHAQPGPMLEQAEETTGGQGGDDVGRWRLSLRQQSGGMRPKRPTGGHAGGAKAGAGELVSQGPFRLRRGERPLPLSRGPVAELHPYQSQPPDHDADLRGIRGRVPGLSRLRGLYEERALWAQLEDRPPRRGVAPPPGLDVHRRSQTGV